MESWIYVFSQFTPEVLLFEAMLILILIAGYAAYWIVVKRRHGALENGLPTGVIRSYLAQLIADAETLRTQLFGLLSQGPIAGVKREIPISISTVDPNAGAQVLELEAKLNEQKKALESLTGEKEKLQKELQEAKNSLSSGTPAAPSSGDSKDTEELQKKIKSLEERLSEYSVIEDDLANLKRLQQENEQLKKALGGGAAAAGAAVATTPAEPSASGVPSEPAPEPSASSEPAPSEPSSEPSADTSGTGSPDFENLVDKVEESLKEPVAAEPTPEPAAAESQSKEDSTSTEPSASLNKGDDDLLSEFEKMLNS